MVEAMLEEIRRTDLYPSLQGEEKISTLYFGGGTPSILSADDLKRIIQGLQERFVFSGDIEITLEANPDDINDGKLAQWRSLGINRLSVGIQSFQDEELKWMNRVHHAAESLSCIDKIRDAGFSNFSADLIYGSPVLSDDDWKKNMDILINRNIPHISCYALTVEPRTALDKMIALQKKEPVDADKQARHFRMLLDAMEQAGYEHYEISNFAKPGFRSKHNSSYWSGATYYGFGPAAHSFDGNKRRWNISNNALYIQSVEKGVIPFEEETLTEIQQLNEYIMTSLRTREGLDLAHVSKVFGEEKSNTLKAAGNKYKNSGKLTIENNCLILTNKGKFFADGIAADLFF